MLVLLADGDEPGDNKTLFYSDDELSGRQSRRSRWCSPGGGGSGRRLS